MGRHGPPTNRSYYLSVAASTLRFAIIIALAVGGVVLINQAFPEDSSGGTITAPDGGTVDDETPPPSPTESPPDRPVPSPTVAGTRVAVFNGAGVTGLAGDTMAALIEQYEYEEAQPVADAPAPLDVTTIYYRANKDEIEAEFVANEFFAELDDVRVVKLQADATEVDRSVQVAIYLGRDYATLVG
jgi:hypothetical protein